MALFNPLIIKLSLVILVNNCKSFMLEKYELFEEINNDIIAKIYISAEQPKYITTENFIFDEETYNETFLKEIRCIIVVNIHIPS